MRELIRVKTSISLLLCLTISDTFFDWIFRCCLPNPVVLFFVVVVVVVAVVVVAVVMLLHLSSPTDL